ncbi:hypothetical protein, partial [uncultured Enorma sp.]|uniref:hypothetical protein n=1 Tax=uncultured Enorma sp. TaxID=1714346 RepID=UPI0026DCE523
MGERSVKPLTDSRICGLAQKYLQLMLGANPWGVFCFSRRILDSFRRFVGCGRLWKPLQISNCDDWLAYWAQITWIAVAPQIAYRS